MNINDFDGDSININDFNACFAKTYQGEEHLEQITQHQQTGTHDRHGPLTFQRRMQGILPERIRQRDIGEEAFDLNESRLLDCMHTREQVLVQGADEEVPKRTPQHHVRLLVYMPIA
jgi:hypothetical protein